MKLQQWCVRASERPQQPLSFFHQRTRHDRVEEKRARLRIAPCRRCAPDRNCVVKGTVKKEDLMDDQAQSSSSEEDDDEEGGQGSSSSSDDDGDGGGDQKMKDTR